jgi:DNA-binding CsgD family transcriptional regulator
MPTDDAPAAVVLAFARAWHLSGRETEVLSMYVLDARSNKQIAAALGITYSTVRLYWMRICQKVGCAAPLQIIERLLRHALFASGSCRIPGDSNTTS